MSVALRVTVVERGFFCRGESECLVLGRGDFGGKPRGCDRLMLCACLRGLFGRLWGLCVGCAVVCCWAACSSSRGAVWLEL